MARWGSAGISRGFLGRFVHHLIGYSTWIPPLIMFNMYVAEVTAINGPSMYPFFNPHYNESLRKDWVLVKKHYLMGHLKRGMIVIFWNPYKPETKTCKRIVGLEGDVIRTRPPYKYPEIIVPEGHVWVEGDGENSQDSNTYGPISARLITGQVSHIVFPFSRAGPVKWWEYPGRPGIFNGSRWS